jgi:hypothetical protein
MLLQKHEAIARELEWQQQQLHWSTPWIASDLIGAAVVSTPSILTGQTRTNPGSQCNTEQCQATNLAIGRTRCLFGARTAQQLAE